MRRIATVSRGNTACWNGERLTGGTRMKAFRFLAAAALATAVTAAFAQTTTTTPGIGITTNPGIGTNTTPGVATTSPSTAPLGGTAPCTPGQTIGSAGTTCPGSSSAIGSVGNSGT